MLKSGEFPAALPLGASAAVRDTVNRTRFRKYWDAELRASVYVSEYVEKNPGWLAAA